MKIAVATKDWTSIATHAGQAAQWLLYDLSPGRAVSTPMQPVRIELSKGQVLHHFKDDGPHPLDGVDVVVARSAGDGFVQHMKKRDAAVILTGETDPEAAVASLLSGKTLPDTRFDITTALCKLRDLFSKH
jgi:predicted Fe-Mo cluster-binding NifX family protein